MAVTIHQVAKGADVSVSTVSRAFTVPDMVNAETRRKVLRVAEELGYQPNRAARGLVTGKTGNIGVVVPDVANPFFSAMLKGCTARAREWFDKVPTEVADAETQQWVLDAARQQRDCPREWFG